MRLSVASGMVVKMVSRVTTGNRVFITLYTNRHFIRTVSRILRNVVHPLRSNRTPGQLCIGNCIIIEQTI